MATAKAGPRKTTRNVTLKLTEGEAELLLALTSMVGGRRSHSPRKYAERVRVALEAALGYNYESTDAYHLGLGSVEFFDYDNHPKITEGMRHRALLESAGVQLHAEFDPRFEDLRHVLDHTTELLEFLERLASFGGQDVYLPA